MAYRLEKNGDDTDLVFYGFEDGIPQNPYDGPDLRQINISTVPGEVSVGFPLTASTIATGTLGRPLHRAVQFSSGQATAYYILDSTSQVFKATTLTGSWSFLSTSNSATGADANNQGLAFYKGYLFKFRDNKIDYLAGGAGTWQTGWKTITGATSHFAIVGIDDVLYFCNGSYVGSIMEVAGTTFDPTNAATYTFNTQAFALPSFDTAVSLADITGGPLLIGGSQNAIYSWDRINPNPTNRIFVADSYMARMVTANTNAFVFTGNTTGRGRIYITNGTQADLYYKIPDWLTGYQEPYYNFRPGQGDAIYHRNKLIFSFTPTDNAGNLLTLKGIFGLDLDTKALSALSDCNGYGSVLIQDQSTSLGSGMSYIVGNYSGSTYDISTSSTAAGTGTGIFKTEQVPVGTLLRKRTFKQIEIKLGTPLQSGESIVVTAIQNFLTNSNVATFNTSGNISFISNVTFQASQWLQLQLSLTGNSGQSGCRIREIRLR